MEKEFKLSEKVNYYELSGRPRDIDVKDVKEFIRRLKEELDCVYYGNLSPEDIKDKIDKLTGDLK